LFDLLFKPPAPDAMTKLDSNRVTSKPGKEGNK